MNSNSRASFASFEILTLQTQDHGDTMPDKRKQTGRVLSHGDRQLQVASLTAAQLPHHTKVYQQGTAFGQRTVTMTVTGTNVAMDQRCRDRAAWATMTTMSRTVKVCTSCGRQKWV